MGYGPSHAKVMNRAVLQQIVELELAQDLARLLDHGDGWMVAKGLNVFNRQRGELAALMAKIDLAIFQHHPAGRWCRDNLIDEAGQARDPAKIMRIGDQRQ